MSQAISKLTPAVSTAISALLVQQPFFASLLFDLTEIVETSTLPDGANLRMCATNGKIIWINPTEFAKHSIDEQMGMLAHEIEHIILLHCQRAFAYHQLGVGPDLKKFSGMKFNKAADYIINASLINDLGFKLPLGTLQNSQITGNDIVDEVYLKLPDDEDEDGQNFDDHVPADGLQDKPMVQAAVKKAEELAKMAGKGTAGLERIIDAICEPQIPWGEHLRKAITTTTRGRDVYTWARPNRRRLAIAPHVYWPGRSGLKGPVIAVEVDMSGSTTKDEHHAFMGELSGILTDVQPEMVYVAYVDDKLCGDIHEIDDVNDLQALALKAKGGGGTDMTEIFNIIDEYKIPAETVVILTDGETPFGEDTGIPTIWCITNEGITAPWGVTVHVRAGENRTGI